MLSYEVLVSKSSQRAEYYYCDYRAVPAAEGGGYLLGVDDDDGASYEAEGGGAICRLLLGEGRSIQGGGPSGPNRGLLSLIWAQVPL